MRTHDGGVEGQFIFVDQRRRVLLFDVAEDILDTCLYIRAFDLTQ